MNWGTPVPQDVRGHDIVVGQLVCYSTNDRHSGLKFGTVRNIKTKHTQRTDHRDGSLYDQWSHTIVMDTTDVTGKPLYETEWDSILGKHEETTIQRRSGRVEHSAGKFMIL